MSDSQPECAHGVDTGCSRRGGHLPGNQADDDGASGAERHPDANFVRPVRDLEHKDAVQPTSARMVARIANPVDECSMTFLSKRCTLRPAA